MKKYLQLQERKQNDEKQLEPFYLNNNGTRWLDSG
jgi:hypothetical protein